MKDRRMGQETNAKVPKWEWGRGSQNRGLLKQRRAETADYGKKKKKTF